MFHYDIWQRLLQLSAERRQALQQTLEIRCQFASDVTEHSAVILSMISFTFRLASLCSDYDFN